MRSLIVIVLLAVVLGCMAKGEFSNPEFAQGPLKGSTFPTERLKSFRGGFDRGDALPARARRPQPAYNNMEFSVPNFFEHELIYLEGNMVLDWQARTGEYRLFELVRQPSDMCPGIPERPVTSGVWETRKFHKFIYVGCSGAPPGGKILDYNPADGTYQIVRFNHHAGPGEDPMLDVLSEGFRLEIMDFQPVYVNEDELFFFEHQTGKFSIYYLNNQLPSKVDPIQPPEPITFGKLQGIHEQLIYVGKNTIMDYDPLFGRYWLYQYDRTAMNASNPLIGPLASGVIEKAMSLAYVADDEMVMLDPKTGLFAFFTFHRPAHPDQYAQTHQSTAERELERAAILDLTGPDFDLKQRKGNFGFGTLIKPNQCAEERGCKSCVQRPGCGWCATTEQCYRGSTEQPCATNCTTWQPVFCDAEPCSSHKGCSNCLSDPFCGWCGDTASCTEGTSSGPLFGQCAGWSKVFCPSQVFGEADVVPSTPCVEGGLISL